jgi:hypothetical protein
VKPTKDNTRHPIQPIVVDALGIHRFKENGIVRWLVEFARGHGTDLDDLHAMAFSNEDWSQVNQLYGYSVSGFADLSCSPDDVVLESLAASAHLAKQEKGEASLAEVDYKAKYYNLLKSIRLYAQQVEHELTYLE